jgi:CBS domain-containing protein
VTDTLVRDAMVPDPTSLEDSATAQEAGRELSDPEVRAVLVCANGGALVGVVTRKTLVREVVAAGLDPRTTQLRAIAEPPAYTLEAEMPLDEAFQLVESFDLERVPVVEDGRLVGILSRAVVQRRLAEDEPPPPEADLGD